LLDTLSSDSKLEAFTKLVASLSGDTSDARHICVLVDYISTLHYVSTELDAKGWNCVRLWGAMSIEERKRAFEEYIKEHRILVASTASITYGVNPDGVTDLIIYDSLMNSTKVAVIERFDSISRKDPLTIHILEKQGGEHVLLPWEQ